MKTDTSTHHERNPSLEHDLSISQQAIVSLETLYPQNPALNVSYGARLRGPLDSGKVARAVRDVSERYEILRINVCRNEPRARLNRFVSTLRVEELENTGNTDREAILLQKVTEETRRVFDIYTNFLLRATLWRLSHSEHLLLLVAHRLVCDELSLEILLDEIGERYAGRELTHSMLSYSRFLGSQSEPSDEEVSFWKNYLAGAQPSLELPTDHPRPLERTLEGGVHSFSIPQSVAGKLREIAEARGTSLYVALLSVFKIGLFRYSRQVDVIVGTPASGRLSSVFKDVVGPVENLIVLRTDLSGDPTFSELLQRVADVIQKTGLYEGVRFETLVAQLRPERDLSRNPFFQVAFQVRRPRGDQMWADDVRCTPFQPLSSTERYDLSLDLIETADSIEGRLSYNTDLWNPSTAARMAEHFSILLEGATSNPNERISRIPFLSEAETLKVLKNFGASASEYQLDSCIHDFFEQQVDKTPDSTAVVCGNERLTYWELNSHANQLAHYLRAEGVAPEILVAVCLERSIDIVVAILAILKAGGAYVPLDPAYPTHRLAAILEDAKAPILLTQKQLVEKLPQSTTRKIELDAIATSLDKQPATNLLHEVVANNLDYVLFTSGSTGRPKGVALEHKSGSILIQWARDLFLPEELAGTLFATSVCFDLSVFELFVPLSVGGTVIIAQDALALPRLPESNQVTLINTVPSAIAELLRLGAIPKSVQVVNLAGEALPDELAQQIYQKTNVQKVYNLYGPTEDTTYSTGTLVPRDGEVTIGRPLPNTQVYILDENRQPLPIGVPGELYLAGDGLARGYWGREDLTRERFVANDFSSHSKARMYRTGDLARFLEDGNIQYLGRIDDQVKLRGFRIELGEIEAVLSKHPSVRSAVVSVREDAHGEKRLVAYIVPSSTAFSAGPLRDLVKNELPGYMVPSAFAQMEALPLSPNGKINRRALPAPDWGTVERDVITEPRNRIESAMVEIWQRALGIPKVGVTDNFFDLGGHSLMAARLLTELEALTGNEIPISALFHSPTIESLARYAQERREGFEDEIAIEIQGGQKGGITFFAIVPPGEESLGYASLARYMGKEQPVYKIQGLSPVTHGKRPYSSEEMQTLAEEYVAAIKTVQPEGPYCLGGMCDGTHIAEQIVLSLEARGDEVGLFAIFDTWVLQHTQRRWLWRLDHYSQRLRQINGTNFMQRLRGLKLVAQTKAKTLATGVSPRTDWQETYWPEGFVPKRFQAPVILFKRPKQPFYYIKDPAMGWALRTESEVDIHELDFPHSEILRDPHVRIFGVRLAERIRQIGQRSIAASNFR